MPIVTLIGQETQLCDALPVPMVFSRKLLDFWQAKKQSVVSKSSTEAEYHSMAMATTELYWIKILFKELNCSLRASPQLRRDNMGALELASNPTFHARTKHTVVDYHFVCEKNSKQKYGSSLYLANQCADIFTKGRLNFLSVS